MPTEFYAVSRRGAWNGAGLEGTVTTRVSASYWEERDGGCSDWRQETGDFGSGVSQYAPRDSGS